MGFLQAVLGGVFTILGAGSMFFIAYKALTIGNDVAEMKELLRELKRGGNSNPLPTANIAYSLPTPLDAFDPTAPPPRPAKEFVLPPPISRRLDAERGIRREAEDEEFGFKSSEQRR